MYTSPLILQAIADLPIWEQDAFRRLVAQNTLSQNDFEEIYSILKAQYGLNPPKQIIPRTLSSNPEATSSGDPVFLESLTLQSTIGILNSGQTLAFDPCQSLVIIHGPNGSGKSSYVRILKRACHARSTGTNLLPNVFETFPKETKPPQVRFTLINNQRPVPVEWIDLDNGGNPHLKSITVFDIDCSGMYVEKGNTAEYMPFGLALLPLLVELRKKLKAMIEAEISLLNSEISSLLGEGEYRFPLGFTTQVGNIYWMVPDYKLVRDKIDRLASLSPQEERTLKLLRQRREQEAGANQRAELIKQSTASSERIVRLTSLRDICLDLRTILNQNTLAEIQELTQSILELRREEALFRTNFAHASAHNQFFHMTGIGTTAWVSLIAAAKAYSEEVAYPTLEFPALGEGHRCLLCHQPFTQQATETMRDLIARFHELQDLETDNQDLEEILSKIQSRQKKLNYHIEQITLKIGNLQYAWTQLQETFSQAFSETCKENLAALFSLSFLDSTTSLIDPDELFETLSHTVGELDDLIGTEQENHENMMALLLDPAGHLQEKSPAEEELEDRSWLSQNKDRFVQYLKSKYLCNKLEAVLSKASDFNTTTITTMAKKVADELVSIPLMQELRRQLDFFGLGYLALQQITSGRSGISTIRLAPATKAFKKIVMSEILSRGEQNLLGIASFFAELEVTNQRGPVVFDDPVADLDTNNKQKVAHRLSVEGLHRQVIIFTHDNEFLTLLKQEAKTRANTLVLRSLTRIGNTVNIMSEAG